MNIQIARLIFLTTLTILKKTLDLLAFKLGKDDESYKYIREQIFDYFYREIKKLFKTLETNKILKRCSCKTSLRKGYKDCECGGSGYLNCKSKDKEDEK